MAGWGGRGGQREGLGAGERGIYGAVSLAYIFLSCNNFSAQSRMIKEIRSFPVPLCVSWPLSKIKYKNR